ncbi:MAG: NUDIX domain-containing protein [Betaproteobacteria bacterium]|jgi:8-oxo-dGTP diphosphatase|nr:NUDIX domain-containing protein [Betaproteobacteria bacterium]HAB47902.1 hypothetical protein [Lautropia sp.]NBP38707.1 NUDIX domain-containing protein [Betaproteobacteria bacterium]NBQ77832.1 NUDIX domain-containing protein [Betaproteobacteria bacterium]NBQ94524.1 NUDIX domain-containing protein [Betaproteobacteria bacterium]
MAIDVAAGVLLNPQGEVLLAQRPQGKVYAGWWEVPGGKFEPGETPHEALARELEEELGLRIKRSSAWCTREYHYAHGHVRLHFRRVWHWDGEPRAMESQAFVWLDPRKPAATWVAPLLPATEPLMAWLALPVCFRGTDACCDQVAWIEAASDEQAQAMVEARSARSTKPVYHRVGDEYRDVLRLAAQSQLASSGGTSSPGSR